MSLEKNSKNASAGQNLIRTAARKDLVDAISGLAEVALDSNLVESVGKELPVIGTVVKLIRTQRAISEELFIRKLERFLVNLASIPSEDRERLLEKYPDDTEEQRVFGENILLTLERLDNVEKPKILARFFAAYIKSEVNYATFTRLAVALERFNLALLPNLRFFYARKDPVVENSEEILHELSLSGLITAQLSGSGTIGGSAGYRYSNLGKDFLRLGFDVQDI